MTDNTDLIAEARRHAQEAPLGVGPYQQSLMVRLANALEAVQPEIAEDDGQAMWARKVLGMADDEPNEATGFDTREAFARLIARRPVVGQEVTAEELAKVLNDGLYPIPEDGPDTPHWTHPARRAALVILAKCTVTVKEA